MTLAEMWQRYKEKKQEEKEELRAMERKIRLEKRLEQKMKTPAQKEYEFYLREDKRRKLDETLKLKRINREAMLKELSSPFGKNKTTIMKEDKGMFKSGVKWV